MDKRVLFMKGSPDAPKCGFSRQFVAILNEKNVSFSHFDILTDESVRGGMLFFVAIQSTDAAADHLTIGLKVVNSWPTFPQFIVNGEFIGGLDIIKDMIENDEFDDAVA